MASNEPRLYIARYTDKDVDTGSLSSCARVAMTPSRRLSWGISAQEIRHSSNTRSAHDELC